MKNIEIIDNEPGTPFTDTNGQRMNDIKLLTILAEAFCKNELVWNHHDEILSRGAALYTGIGQKGKRMTVEEYVTENIKESRGKYYGKEEK